MLLFNSCYQRIEGCTDINAVNFNAMADDKCCCNYPSVNFQLQHRFGADSVRFFLDSTYLNPSGVPFKVLSLEMLASSFFLEKEDGIQIKVTEEIDFSGVSGLNCPCTDDFFLIRPTDLNTTPGTVSVSGEYSSLSFSPGIPADFSVLTPIDFPEGHLLNSENRYDTLSGSYYSFRSVIVIGESPGDTLAVNILDWPGRIELDGPIILPTGQNVNLRLRIDYKKWFGNIDSSVSDPSAIRENLMQNLKEAFTLVLE
ncbi:MAG: hypothetical protein EA409_00595 [Saprospirales bacterium]|nr:MAG: hypothetical protein EA409_00595 [Saprospirales bacterium]